MTEDTGIALMMLERAMAIVAHLLSGEADGIQKQAERSP